MAKRYTGAYVSRGGEKLRAALNDFAYCPRGLRALDIGASTGGFTDCLLQAGAAQVTALDVAYGQFAWKLRQDARVQVVERSNIKNVDLASLGAPFDVVVADLSFIALRTLTEQLKCSIGEKGDLLLLVKPQFESLRSEVDPGGVIRDPQKHQRILQRLGETFVKQGLLPRQWTYSAIKGSKGNIEYWLWARRAADDGLDSAQCADITNTMEADIAAVVAHAHAALTQTPAEEGT
ncbi:MAG: TlyA family RNA methyltransferase [Coriobacteriia bacterium]|nr:TlyA family RNA methyltransferase [Coriobacteriia bacterium]